LFTRIYRVLEPWRYPSEPAIEDTLTTEPCLESRSAVAAPTPVPEPVMMATLRSVMVIPWFDWFEKLKNL
jgi:hypothetical protein